MLINYLKKEKAISDRTWIVYKNIIGSFAIKGIGILTSFLLVPFTVNLLDKEKYGVWITIFAIVNWFNMMDIGLGNGFRNKFAEAIATNNKKLAKAYVQTLYSSLTIISVCFFLIFLFVNPFIKWHSILNLPSDFNENINRIVLIVFGFFCLLFILRNLSVILLSMQKTTLSNTLAISGNILSLILIFLVDKFYTANLFSIAFIFMLSPLIVYSIASLVAFNTILKEYKPKLLSNPFNEYFHILFGLGSKFFLIQITFMLLTSSSSIIISQLYGPAEVTPYNITNQLFVALQFFFSIIITPFWSAFTEANAKKDFGWIKNSIKKLILIWMSYSTGVLIVWLISPVIIKIWLGGKIFVPYHLSLQFAIFSIISSWANIFVFYINGVGKIKIQLYLAVIQMIIFIPLAILLAKNLGLDTTGIILATNLCVLLPAIFMPLQYYKLINNKASGRWAA